MNASTWRGPEPLDIRTIDSFLPVRQDDDPGVISGKRVLTDEQAQFSLQVGFGFG